MSTHLNRTAQFEEALSANLALYLHVNEDQGNIFQANREISIARFALSQQAQVYYQAIQILTSLLESVQNDGFRNTEGTALTNVMTAIAAIEAKSKSLIESVHSVTRLIKDAAEIDIDKSALRTLVVNMPVLVKQSITKISGDENLADSVSLSLNNQIGELMTACRLDRETLLPQTSSPDGARGINPEQFVDLFNTVPSVAPQLNASTILDSTARSLSRE